MTVEEIVSKANAPDGITDEDFFGPKRSRSLQIRRNLVMFYIHYKEGISTYKIAELFKRDRRHICRWISRVKYLIDHDSYVKNEYNTLLMRWGDY
jgi:chromosomal replication initiation ATPase DnaA